jgi:SAM-dependent methyltransferase
MSKHWTEKMFIDEAEIYGETLKQRIKKTDEEIHGLLKLFQKYHVPDDGVILDLACGIGRHSIPLAKKGYNITGVDLSPMYISEAKKYADEHKVTNKVHFIEGDMRTVEEILKKCTDSFDVVLNLFTSMGYWDEKTDRRIFTQAHNLTKNGGIFIIHSANRDFLVKNFQARDIISLERGRVMLADRRLDLENSRIYNVWRYFDQVEDDLRHLSTFEFDHRVYSLHELKKLVEDSGWRYQSSYGGFNMEDFSIDTFSMVLIAKK